MGGAERQRVTALAHRSGVPYVPSLAVAVHLALHQGLFCHSRNPWSDELAAQNFSVVRMPVFLLCHGQRLEEPLGNDVFDSVQIRALTVGPNGELRCKSLAPTSSNRVFADLSSPSGVLSCCAWLATPNPTNKARTATALIPTARSGLLERLMTGLLLKRRIDCQIQQSAYRRPSNSKGCVFCTAMVRPRAGVRWRGVSRMFFKWPLAVRAGASRTSILECSPSGGKPLGPLHPFPATRRGSQMKTPTKEWAFARCRQTALRLLVAGTGL